MPVHPWLQSLDTIAICPKCGEAALHRSRSKTAIEKIKRRYTFKRQFRCQKCGWRGWYEETRLRYPIPAAENAPPLTGEANEIPTLNLEENRNPSHRGSNAHPGRRGKNPAHEQGDDEPRRMSASDSSLKSNTMPMRKQEARPGDERDFQPPDFYDHDKPPELSLSLPVPEERKHKGSLPFTCPNCGKGMLFRSRHRGKFELVRKNITGKRPYRCHGCGWRGWLKKL